MNEIERMLNEKYYLIKKNRIFYLIGGFMGAAIAILGITYTTGSKAVTDAIKREQVKIAKEEILDMRDTSRASFKEIRRYLSQIKEKGLYHTGQAKHGATIKVPAGTTSDQWDLVLIPNEIGYGYKEEPDYMWDNSLIYYLVESEPIKIGWKVHIRNINRIAHIGSSSDLKNKFTLDKPHTVTVTYILIPRLLQMRLND